MKLHGIAMATADPDVLRVISNQYESGTSEFGEATIAAGEFKAGDPVVISITPPTGPVAIQADPGEWRTKPNSLRGGGGGGKPPPFSYHAYHGRGGEGGYCSACQPTWLGFGVDDRSTIAGE